MESVSSQTKGTPSPRWAFMQPFDIYARDGSGDVYLHRLRVFQTPLFSMYLHDINMPDSDRDPHDHPWSFVAIILRGGYTERIWENVATGVSLTRLVRRKRWSIHKMGTTEAHKIETIEARTKSLVFTGPRRRNWGFWTADGFVRWQDYV